MGYKDKVGVVIMADGCGQECEEESFAMSLLKDYKKQCKNWFIALMAVLGLWFTTIGGFIWYIQP